MYNQTYFHFIFLLKNLIFHPKKVFHEIHKQKYASIIYFSFGLSCTFTFVKSFIENGNYNIFCSSDLLLCVSLFLDIPQIRWLLSMLSFCFFLFLTTKFCNLLLKKCNTKNLIICLISLSIVGIFLQSFFLVINFIISPNILHILRSLSYVWIFTLSIFGIKYSQDTTYFKSFIIFAMSLILPSIIIGWPGAAPYLIFIISE